MIRVLARTTQAFIDLLVLSVAFWLAFLLRFEWQLPLMMWKRLLFTWPYVVAFQFLVLMAWGVPRFAWRYVGMREATRILYATATSTAALLVVRFLAGELRPAFGYALYALIPTGVIIINFGLVFL